MNEVQTVAQNLQKIISRINEYESRYHRPPHSVKLLGATKGQSIEKIRAAYDAGLMIFGENYLQEALVKIEALADKPSQWHFIGPIQSNKIKKIAEHFSWVESVSTEAVAKMLNDKRPSNLPPLNICIEVNISGEKTKSGIKPSELFSFAKYCQTLPQLKLRGLMTIPHPSQNFKEQSHPFHELKKLYDELITQGFALDTLSMGMSDDLEAAIANGATLVRIGTAIFGPRPK